MPEGGVRCAQEPSCDPERPEGGTCYGVPGYGALVTNVEIWVADPSAPGGGWKVVLSASTPVTLGGHTYQNRGDGLFGSGGGIYGDVVVARDGVANWIDFHATGFAAYRGGGIWDWPATMSVSENGAPAVTFGREYTVTRTGSACPPFRSAGLYTFVAEQPPRACAFGVDLVSFVLPGE
jgi:hypothetical protein